MQHSASDLSHTPIDDTFAQVLRKVLPSHVHVPFGFRSGTTMPSALQASEAGAWPQPPLQVGPRGLAPPTIVGMSASC